MKNQEIIEIWKSIFPKSTLLSYKYSLGDNGYYFKGKLADSINECINHIWENDPLYYSFEIENNIYKEINLAVLIKPDNNLYCYSRAKIRKKTIKNINTEKLKNRFLEIKKLIIDNKENFINLSFNINDKI